MNSFECSSLVISSGPQIWVWGPKNETFVSWGRKRHINFRRPKTMHSALKKKHVYMKSPKLRYQMSTQQVNKNNFEIKILYFVITFQYAVSAFLASISMKSFLNSNILFLQVPEGSSCLLFGATSFSRHGRAEKNRTLSFCTAPGRVCQLV